MKKRLPVILAVLFLVQSIPLLQGTCAENYLLNPPSRVNLSSPDTPFREIYEVFCAALTIYKLDAIEGHSKEALMRECAAKLPGKEINFDLRRIDMGKKGWTRYYPFSIGDRHFIIRIFLTEERAYQAKAQTLFEGAIDNPAVTFQILPGINDILKDCRIAPYKFYPSSEADKSP